MSPVSRPSDRDIRAMLDASMHWDEATWLAYHQSQLSQLLMHAKEHCAFYVERLDHMFRTDGTIDWENWQEVPIVTRSDLRGRAEEMRAKWLPPRHGAICVATSSGSTGVPITVHTTELAMDISRLAWSRFHQLHGLLPFEGLVEFKAFLPDGQLMSEDTLQVSNNGVPSTYINRNLSTGDKLRLLKEAGCRILIDTTNHAEVLAHENLRAGSHTRLNTVIGIGMGFSQVQRDLLKESFGARCLSPYSSKEGTFMAFQCPHDEGHFHVNSELVYLEVLDTQGLPVSEGKSGRCIITPLFNSAQPLIRYDHGDVVKLGGQCSCGIRLPVLAAVMGRSDAIFRFPGKQIALTRFDDVMVQRVLQADAYQFAQIAPMQIEVRYVSASDAGAEECQQVSNHLRHLLQVDALITFSRVDAIPFNAGEKQQRIVREFEVAAS